MSKSVNDKIKWKTGNYEFLFQIKPIIIPKKLMIVKEHIRKLKFLKNKEKWYTYFQFPKRLSDEDLNDIENNMKK